MATSLDLSKTYTSYSGVDIRVVINGEQIGSMQALSYAIQREKAPIYVMGSVDPISYSRGKRGIAGTMISLLLDTHILSSKAFEGEQYLGRKNEMFAQASTSQSAQNNQLNQIAKPGPNNENQIGLGFVGGDAVPDGTLTAGASGSQRLSNANSQFNVDNLGSNYLVQNVFYVDQILPFDVAIIAANEYGQSAQMRLYGCEILNEGSGFSIDDIVVENQMTYVCRTILPWRSFDLKDGSNSLRDKIYSKDNQTSVAYQRSN